MVKIGEKCLQWKGFFFLRNASVCGKLPSWNWTWRRVSFKFSVVIIENLMGQLGTGRRLSGENMIESVSLSQSGEKLKLNQAPLTPRPQRGAYDWSDRCRTRFLSLLTQPYYYYYLFLFFVLGNLNCSYMFVNIERWSRRLNWKTSWSRWQSGEEVKQTVQEVIDEQSDGAIHQMDSFQNHPLRLGFENHPFHLQ